MADIAGFNATDLAAYFGLTPQAGAALMNLYGGGTLSSQEQKLLGGLNPSRFAPGATGPNQGYGDIAWGLEHLAEHPKGSHYHGDIDIGRTLADLGTFGAYSAIPRLAHGQLAGLTDLGVGPISGSFAKDVGGNLGKNIYLGLGEAAIGGALLGGATGAGGAGSGASTAASTAPYYGGVLDLGPGAMTGVDAAGNPLYQGATAFGKGAMTAGELGAAGVPSLTMGGGLAASGGGLSSGSLLGAGLMGGGSLAKILAGGASPQALPSGGGLSTGGQAGGLTPQQLAALTAQQSQAHQGLAPQFQARMAGSREAPGISTLSQLYGQGGQ